MHGVWAVAVCLCHAQNAGLLSGLGIEPEENVTSAEKLVPFVVMTGAQALTYWAAFAMSKDVEPAKDITADSIEGDIAKKRRLNKLSGQATPKFDAWSD